MNKIYNTKELTKSDWERLIKFNIVDAPNNGFASTSKPADDLLRISSYRDTIVIVNTSYYTVRYYSGCFYPMWYKITTVIGGKIEAYNNIDKITIKKPLE